MVAAKYQEYMYGLLWRVVNGIGPRPACSQAERELSRLLVREWTPLCDTVAVESFTCSPRAFLGFLPVCVLSYLAATALYWFYPWLSFGLATVALGLLFFELIRYHEVIDFLFPRMRGANVAAVIHPRSQIEKRVIVSAHQDSAYEFRLWHRFRNAALVLMALAVFALLLMFAASLAKTIGEFTGLGNATGYNVAGIVAAGLAPIVAFFFFFRSDRAVPGAMDDMAGIAVLAGLGKYLDEAKHGGGFFPRRTEVMLLATSSEEAGLRGAKRYVKKHLKEMKEIRTYGVFLDGLYDERFLTVTSREVCTWAKHDPKLVRLAQEVAAGHGWSLGTRWLPLGATDASAFSSKGIPAVCLHCADMSRLPHNYHTREDTCENVRPESLSVMLQIVVDMIERIDD
jgi:aminopeptidase YwaD